MALGGALVDRATVLRRDVEIKQTDPPEEKWIGGERQLLPPGQSGEPNEIKFRCRFMMINGSEQQQDGRRRRVTRPRLMMGRKLTVKKGDKIKVLFRQKPYIELYGSKEVVFQVDGDPQEIRKRQRVIGWEANLVRAE
jgi:hypothetical protein